ncbi:amino acid deaminase [Streptomyces sp. NP160]|uniref:amino acid deaminase n=1 Tax=Streptomyces sp. NP160 TaxID=2586637 RepID=UPI00111B1219|nr:amino acid deaminase [Streptomyces sp. NP160]TNM67001.1 amino acid deaminase [Streptomyces sp. NP160]
MSGPRFDADAVGVLGPWAKAVPVSAWGTTGADWVDGSPGLAELPTPVLTLDASAVAHNTAAMAGWARGAGGAAGRGVDLAPHGKTSMAPALWRAQLAAGAWAVTVATPWQLAVALDAGVPRVLVAGPLLDARVHALAARSLAAGRARRVLVWADGEDVVAATAAARARSGAEAAPPLDVLVELGAPGRRTGARSVDAALAVARAVTEAPGLRLAGAAGYEGALVHDASPGSLAVVRSWLRELRDLHERLAGEGLLDGLGGDAAVVSAGGSAYFDLVAEELGDLHDPAGEHGPPTRLVVRAGASVAHDDGFYSSVTPSTRGTGPVLRAGLHGWARVISRPEPGLALLDAGKRDLPFDEGLPVAQAVRRGGRGPVEPLPRGEVTTTALNDQHAFLRLAAGAGGLAVGDVVRLGLSHPCTAFDRWGLLPVLDDARADEPRVVGLLRTVFG